METAKKLFGFIATVAIITFSMAGCEQPTDEPAHVHDSGTWHTTLAATCEADGTRELRCTVCNAVLPPTETTAITKLGHDWETATIAATETEDGIENGQVCKHDNKHRQGGTITYATGSAGLAFAGIPDDSNPTAYRVSKGDFNGDELFIPAYHRPAGSTNSADYKPVTEIGDGTNTNLSNAFGGTGSGANANTTLTSVTFAEESQLKTISNWAFYYCTNLTDINIPAGVTAIGSWVFSNCTNLASITIDPANTNFATQDGILYNAAKTTIVFVPISISGSITIPNSITGIGVSTFMNCTNLASVTFAEDSRLETIDMMAFYGCTSLASITLPASVTTISDNVFGNCTSLTEITIPASVTYLSEAIFFGCTNLASVTFEGTITSSRFDTSAFNGLGDLRTKYFAAGGRIGTYTTTAPVDNSSVWTKQQGDEDRDTQGLVFELIGTTAYRVSNGAAASGTVVIPATYKDLPVTAIGDGAFSGCSDLTSVTIPEGVTSIGNEVFQDCTSITGLTIPASVMTIGESAFRNSGLTSIIIPDSVDTISNATFYDCTDLTNVTIPNSVTEIGIQAFWNCTSLASITIPASVTSISINAFNGCTRLASVNIPNSVTSIMGGVFSGCTRLASVNIPNSVTSIMGSAFSGCTSLTEITIPADVTYIGGSAFSGCTSLTSVEFKGTIATSGFSTSAFNGLGDLRAKYLASGIGTYTTTAPVSSSSVWVKQ